MPVSTRIYKCLLFLLLVGFTHIRSYSQNDRNYINVTNLSLNFNLDTYTKLETEQIVTEGIQILTESTRNYVVFVRVSSSTSTSGIPFTPSLIAMQLNRKIASSQNVAPTGKMILSSVNQQLFSDNNRTSNNGDNFYYNFFLGPVGYTYPPGNYTVTLLFTMTQP